MTRGNYRVVRFLQSPLGRFIEKRLYRWGPYKRLTSRLVWAEVLSDTEYRASLDAGLADADAGRMFAWSRTGRGKPSSKWSPTDPVQPDGWHHDGTDWVLNDDGGWFQSGDYWRYNHPGDPGWTENADGSWRYVKAVA